MDNKKYLSIAADKARDEWKYANAQPTVQPLKMIYSTHNLKSNFMNANAAGDTGMNNDIVISEVAKLILSQPKNVVAALQKYGFEVKSMDPHDITDAVGEALNKSKAFATAFANGIISNQTMSVVGARHGVAPTLNAIGDIFTDASQITSSLGSIFGGGTKATGAAGTAQVHAAVAAKAPAAKAGSSVGLYIGIALGVVTVIVGVIAVSGGFSKKG